MLTVAEIRNVKFSRAVGGYKSEDVDVLLDKIEADYAAFERIIKDYEVKVQTLNGEIESFKNSQNSIQNVLVSAQSLADNIVKEAKEKSEAIIAQAENNIISITEKEKELSAAFEIKAQEQKATLEKELKAMVEKAQTKADAITGAAEERVKQQQMLFDKLKLEIASFKTGVTAKYKEHIELLSKLPDSVPNDPKYIAEVVSASYDKVETKRQEEPKITENYVVSSSSESAKADSKGFVVDLADSEEDE